MPVLEMSHQGEPLPLHPVTSSPEAGNVISAQRTVQSYRVILNLLRRLECLHQGHEGGVGLRGHHGVAEGVANQAGPLAAPGSGEDLCGALTKIAAELGNAIARHEWNSPLPHAEHKPSLS